VEAWALSIAAEHGFTDVSHTVEVFGTCAMCAKAARRKKA
jgi:Fur family ferric uptake transcriptional regulator